MIPMSDSPSLRNLVYAILITAAAGSIAGRIVGVTDVYEPYKFRAPGDTTAPKPTWPAVRPTPTPTLGGNDRSRWATVRALVDDGTYVIGHRDDALRTPQNPYGDTGIMAEDGWKTFDKVQRPDTKAFYSSKPPLLPTLLAGEYWVLKKALGWSITDPHGQVIRTILMTVNWLPFVISLILLARLVEPLGTTDWGRLFVFAAGCFATYQVTFAITLNNHTVACWSALFTLYFVFRGARDEAGVRSGGVRSEEKQTALPTPHSPLPTPHSSLLTETLAPRPSSLILAGFFAAFTACNELPAASLAVALLVLLLTRMPGPTLRYFVPAALVPVAAFFVTNYLAIGQWAPAYGEFGGPWYNYPGSHWRLEPGEIKPGIDFAWQKETKLQYAVNLLIGHHGLFSLSPIFLLAVAGMFLALGQSLRFGGDRQAGERPAAAGAGGLMRFFRELPPRPLIAGLSLVIMVTVVAFYIVKTGNYGGWTAGPRWLMWLTPLFLLAMLPCVDWLAGRRWGRWLGYVLLGFSVLSVSYPAWNPWRHPWIYNLLEALGRITY